MKMLVLTAVALFLAACANPVGFHPVPPTPDVGQEDIDNLVQQKNVERRLYGLPDLAKGLSCRVQEVSSGSCLSASTPGCAFAGQRFYVASAAARDSYTVSLSVGGPAVTFASTGPSLQVLNVSTGVITSVSISGSSILQANHGLAVGTELRLSENLAIPSNAGTPITLSGLQYLYKYDGNLSQQAISVNMPTSLLTPNLQDMFLGKTYRIVCSGHLVVTDTDYYEFQVSSDDAAILSVAGRTVVNADGDSGFRQKSGVIGLPRGVHAISVSYAQTNGASQGLVVEANGEPLSDKKLFY